MYFSPIHEACFLIDLKRCILGSLYLLKNHENSSYCLILFIRIINTQSPAVNGAPDAEHSH